MSYFTYIAFPRNLHAFRLSDIVGREKEFGIHYDTTLYRKDLYLFPNISPKENHIAIFDKENATFKDCFKNKFVYGFGVDVPHHEKRINILRDFKGDEKEYELLLGKRAAERMSAYNQALTAFITQIIDIGEFVEIYSEFTDHVNFDLGPPALEREIELKSLSTMEDWPNSAKSRKLTIHYSAII